MKRVFIGILWAALLTTACGCALAPLTVPPTEQTVPADATAVNAIPSIATATTIVPTNPPGCADRASFEADVTVPDNFSMKPGVRFTKTWRLRNTGGCAWNSQYRLVFASGERMGAADSVPLAYTPPGAALDISIELISPAQNGAFTANFELHNAEGNLIPVDDGRYVWVSIRVGETVAAGLPSPSADSAVVPPPDLSVNAPCAYTPNPDFVNQTAALINSQRAAHGLPLLALNALLTAAAQNHAADMACNSFISHIGSDGSNVKTRVAAAGYVVSVVFENIYAQPPQYGGTPDTVVQWWMSDLVHRNAILHPAITEFGVGYAYYADSPLGGYWSVVLAAP